MTLLRLLWLVSLAALWCPGQAWSAIIKDIRMWHAPDHSRIVFDMDQNSRYEVFTLDNPGRVVIDIRSASLRSDIPHAGTTGQFIQRIYDEDRLGR